MLLLKEAGMRKVNFAGYVSIPPPSTGTNHLKWRTFLYPKFLGELARYCKQDLDLESVSVVTNGTKVTRRWLEQHGAFVDIIAVSCDSFDERVNKAIGKCEPGREADNVAQLRRVAH